MTGMKMVRIVSDGTLLGTSVLDAGTGAEIHHVISIDWHIEHRSLPTATVKVYSSEFDVTTRATIIPVCPRCQAEWTGRGE